MKRFLVAKLRTIENENSRKTFLINTFGLIGLITSIVFGIEGVKENREQLYNISLFSMATIVAINFIYFQFKKNIAVSAHVIILTFFVISLMLFTLIGVNGSGVLWYYVFSGLAILLTDTKKGVIYILLIIILTIFFYVNPLNFHVNKYPADFIIRFFASYIVVNLFILIFEFARSRSYSAYMKTFEEVKRRNNEISAQKDEIIKINAEIAKKNSELQELNASKDKFFSIIAHDLKNPFHAILGFSELLETSLEENTKEENLNYLNIIQSSTKNVWNLLENLLEWSRSQTGKINFIPQDILLKEIAIDCCKICENLVKAKNILISYDIPSNLIVYADRNMLNTVIRNLLTNAIKFTHKGGKISISSKQRNSEVEISVSDTGIGMDEKTMNKLFKINEKISILGTEEETGTGLGLLLCKEFVEKHGGKIWVESELRKGSNFIFSIPLKSK